MSKFKRISNNKEKYPSTFLEKLSDLQKLEIERLRKDVEKTQEYLELERIRRFCMRDSSFYYRYLRGSEWNREIALKRIKITFKWRKSTNPSNIDIMSMINFLKKHHLEDLKGIYSQGFTKEGRPIVYMNPEEMTRIPLDEEGVEICFMLIVLVMEDIFNNIPEGRFDFDLVIDHSQIGLTFGNVIRKVGKKFSRFGCFYSGTLHKAYAVNVGWIVRGLWSVATLFMDSGTSDKFILEKDMEILSKIIDDEIIPKEFGGKHSELDFRMIDYLEFLLEERQSALYSEKEEEEEGEGEEEREREGEGEGEK